MAADVDEVAVGEARRDPELHVVLRGGGEEVLGIRVSVCVSGVEPRLLEAFEGDVEVISVEGALADGVHADREEGLAVDERHAVVTQGDLGRLRRLANVEHLESLRAVGVDVGDLDFDRVEPLRPAALGRGERNHAVLARDVRRAVRAVDGDLERVPVHGRLPRLHFDAERLADIPRGARANAAHLRSMVVDVERPVAICPGAAGDLAERRRRLAVRAEQCAILDEGGVRREGRREEAAVRSVRPDEGLAGQLIRRRRPAPLEKDCAVIGDVRNPGDFAARVDFREELRRCGMRRRIGEFLEGEVAVDNAVGGSDVRYVEGEAKGA